MIHRITNDDHPTLFNLKKRNRLRTFSPVKIRIEKKGYRIVDKPTVLNINLCK
jgi:hypothetical protein